MTSLPSLLVLGFLLGMRHATDADHVVAVTTLLQRDKSLRGAALLGSLWGVGHTATVFVVGGAIVLFDLVVPPRLGLALELGVGLMLVALGALSLRAPHRHPHGHDHAAPAAAPGRSAGGLRFLRPLAVGIMHGLAGSAAIALLVLGTIRDTGWALAYLAIFGAGTVAGMALITAALALPLRLASSGVRTARWIGVTAGIASVALGLFVVYRVGFVDGLFTGHPHWIPG